MQSQQSLSRLGISIRTFTKRRLVASFTLALTLVAGTAWAHHNMSALFDFNNRFYTALFSNTEHAHRLGRTDDWVVIYWDGGHGERQCTVITARRGPAKGRRIVRGRDWEPALRKAVAS